VSPEKIHTADLFTDQWVVEQVVLQHHSTLTEKGLSSIFDKNLTKIA
jgi:hypothetical protein